LTGTPEARIAGGESVRTDFDEISALWALEANSGSFVGIEDGVGHFVCRAESLPVDVLAVVYQGALAGDWVRNEQPGDVRVA
jgi:hypothetical protein